MTRRARKRLTLVLVAGVVTIIAALGAYTLRQAQKQRLMARKLEEGMAAYQSRDYEAAIDPLAFYFNANGADPEATYALADSRRRVPAENDAHLGAAIKVVGRAVDLAPDKLKPLELQLELYALVGYMTEQLATADRILAIDPAHSTAMNARIGALLALGRREDALAAARRMAEALPDNIDAHRAVVSLLQVLDHPRSEMRDYAADLAARYPQSVRAAALHAETLVLAGQTDDAIELARRTAQVPAESVKGVSELLRIFDTLNMDQEAGEFLDRQLAAADAGAEIIILATERAWKNGRPAEARRLVEPAAALGNDEALGWLAFLETEGAEGSPGNAAKKTLESRNNAASSYWLSLIAGRDAMQAGDAAAARDHIRSALATRPNNDLADFLLGRVYESVGDWPLAVKRWENVVERDRGYRVARLALVSTLLRHDRIEGAREHASLALSARSGLTEVYGLSRAFIAAIEAGRSLPGDFDRVVSVLEDLRGRPATDPVVMPLLARAYLGAGEIAQAEAVVNDMLQSGAVPATEDVAPLVAALRRAGSTLADSVVAAAREASPDDADLIYLQAIAAAQSGKPAEGRRALEEMIANSDGDARKAAQLQLAIFLDRTGDPSARERFAELAAAAPQNPRMQLALLESQAAWSDNATVAEAIGRLRAVAGEASPFWKLFEARRLLLFERESQSAAKVVQLLADVLRADPDSPVGMTLMADAMLLLDDRAKAIDFLARVVDSQTVPALYPTLINLLSESGRTDDVQRRLREFLLVRALPVELRRTRAQLLAANSMIDEAMREFESLASSGNPADELNLARICIRRGDHDRANQILDRLLAGAEPAPAAVLTAAEVAALEGDIDRGLRVLDKLPATLSAAERAIHRASFLDRHGRIAEAEQLFKQAAAGGTAEAAAALVRFYITSGRTDDASAALATAIAAHPGDPELIRLQSVSRITAGESLPAGSIADVAALVLTEGNEQTRERFLEIMRVWETGPKDLQAHISRLRRLTETSPTFYPGWLALVGALLESGNTRDAAQSARIAARVMPNDPRAARMTVAALTRNGELADALDMAQRWRGRMIGSTLEADCVVADLTSRLGRPADAIAVLDKWKDRIVAEAAGRPERVELFAGLLADARRADDAHALLWPMAQQSEIFAKMYLRVAGRIAGDSATRAAWISRAEPLVANDPEGRLLLADAWYSYAVENGDSTKLSRVIELLGDDPKAHPNPGQAAMLLAASHEASGNPQAALRFYPIALELVPDDPTMLNNYAYLLVNTGGSADTALRHADRAVQLADAANYPAAFRASFLDTRGVVLLRLERFAAAQEAFSRALSYEPRDIGLLIGSAEALARGGDTSSASATVKRIDAMLAEGGKVTPQQATRLETVRGLLRDAGATPN